MAVGAGIGAQLGIGTETTFNTGVTVNHWLEFTSESIKFNKTKVNGLGLRAGGLVTRSQRSIVTKSDASGDIMLDFPTRGGLILLAHALGSFPSPVTLASGVYQYTFTLGDVYGHSFTAQVGVPQYNGTVTPKTVTGAKITAMELACSTAGLLTGKFTLDAAGFTTGTALATASYAVLGSVFSFVGGAVQVNGTTVAYIRDFSVVIDNVLNTGRFNLGGLGVKLEQTHNGFRKISGKLTAEFSDTTLLTAFLNDTATSLNVSFQGALLSTGYYEGINITLPSVKFTADTPVVNGPGSIDVTMSFDVLDNGAAAPVTIVATTADSAI